jgi:hypothetical protein
MQSMQFTNHEIVFRLMVVLQGFGWIPASLPRQASLAAQVTFVGLREPMSNDVSFWWGFGTLGGQ